MYIWDTGGECSENSAKLLALALPTGMSSLGLHLCPLVSPSNNPRTSIAWKIQRSQPPVPKITQQTNAQLRSQEKQVVSTPWVLRGEVGWVG